MLKEERFDKILKMLTRDEKVNYSGLAQELNVSEDTVRRDIEALHNNGLLSKVRGGAIPLLKNPLSFADRASYHTDKKEIIALKARQFIHSGQTIFMDGGTTNCSIAAKLPIDIKLKIITNNIPLVQVLANHKNVEVILLGGFYNTQTQTTEGVKACEEVGLYIADLYLLGTCAVDSKFGVTASFLGDSGIKTAMCRSAKSIIALANEEKLNTTEPFMVCRMEEITVLITDLASNDFRLNGYRRKETKIV